MRGIICTGALLVLASAAWGCLMAEDLPDGEQALLEQSEGEPWEAGEAEAAPVSPEEAELAGEGTGLVEAPSDVAESYGHGKWVCKVCFEDRGHHGGGHHTRSDRHDDCFWGCRHPYEGKSEKVGHALQHAMYACKEDHHHHGKKCKPVFCVFKKY